MKIQRHSLIFIALILGGFVLSACSGTLVNTWPGVTATQNTIYLADKGSIFAINPTNGALVCKFPEKADPSKPFYAAPAVSDNLIAAGNYGRTLYGLDPNCDSKTSAFPQKWSFNTETDDPAKKAGDFAGSPLIVKDTVFAPSTNNRLYAIDANSGKMRWMFETGNTLWATPASDGTTLYLAALDHNLYALRVSDGSLVWKKDLGSALPAMPLLTQDGALYVSTMGGSLEALKASDGSPLWTAKTSGGLWSTPVLNKDTLYVGNASSKVYAISAKDGSIVWQKDATGAVLGGGLLLQDGVAFPTESGDLAAWSLDGQKQLWTQKIGGKLYTTPVISGQTAAVALTDGGDKLLQALNLNGQLTWTFTAPK